MIQNSFSEDQIDIRYYELEYSYNASLFGIQTSATIKCRPIKDTLINQLNVLQYQFIKIQATDFDTSYDYLLVNDSTLVNYAWQGSTPAILLKTVSNDPVYLEETPYTIFVFPYQLNKDWTTRPVSTGLQSNKRYVAAEKVTVPAGTFNCNKIHTDLSVKLLNNNQYCEQWISGNALIKSYINDGENILTDSAGIQIGKTLNWETFELKSFRFIDPLNSNYQKKKQIDRSITISKDLPHIQSIILNGRKLNNYSKATTNVIFTYDLMANKKSPNKNILRKIDFKP